MVAISVVHHPDQPTAGVRRQVPLDEMTEFFAHAFSETLAVLREQGVAAAGPPFGKYYGMPGALVDVEAGFPVGSPVTPDGEVVPGDLPAGRVVEAEHVGPYDTLQETYAELQKHFAASGLVPSDVMWESYLSDPDENPDPATWRTRVCWPVVESLTAGAAAS